jgi:transaldolase
MNLTDLRVKIFADGADLTGIRQLANIPYIKGFTTNPTLMRKAGVDDYEMWARRVLEAVPDRPVSFEVLSDDFDEMERQARKIASWGENVYVKIPITNTKGQSACSLIQTLTCDGLKINVTAIMTIEQIKNASQVLYRGAPSIISVFAGRVADTGRDEVDLIQYAMSIFSAKTIEYLWASTRELRNIMQANRIGCHIITVPDKLLNKLHFLGKDLNEFSLETVKMFYDDAVAAGYTL